LRGYLQDKTPAFQFAALMVLWFVCFNAMQLLMAGALVAYYGPENYKELADNLMSGNISNNLLKLLQMGSSVGLFLLPALLFYFMQNENPLRSVQVMVMPNIILLFLTLGIIVFAAPFIISMTELNQKMQLPSYLTSLEQYLKDAEMQSEQMLKRLLVMNTKFDFALNMLMLALLPAICEEIFFRGTLQPLLTRLYGNVHIAVIMSAMIFSFIHFQFYGFLPRMILGMVLGYMFVWTNNLWYAILAHLLNNGLQVVALYLYQKKTISYNIETSASPEPLYVLGSTALMFYVLWLFHRKSGSFI
jgi:membrane protease YdiL (CAAX protease family)